MPVLLECAIDRANTDDGPLAVAALASLVDAEPASLSALATKAVERKAELARLMHEPSKAHSAAALISVLSRALPAAQPLFLDIAGMLPMLAPRLDVDASTKLAQDAVHLLQDPKLREILGTPAAMRWLSGLLAPPSSFGDVPPQVLPALQALTSLTSVPAGLSLPDVGPPLSQLLALLTAHPDAPELPAATLLVEQIATSSHDSAVGCHELGLSPALLTLLQPEATPQGRESEPKAAARVHAARALCSMALSDERVRAAVKEHLSGAASHAGDPVLAMHMDRLIALAK